MNRLTSSIAVVIAASLSQGCATTRQPEQIASIPPGASALESVTPIAPSRSCAGRTCAADVMRVAQKTEVPVEKNAPSIQGHPLTSVVVTQCNLIVAVYMTMEDGRLLRFDHGASVPADQLLQMAYAATRSERVEVSCNDADGVVGYEKHEPI
jgi:hypothetical protein